MGIMVTSALHSEFIYWVDVLLHSFLRPKHRGLGLKERRDFGIWRIWWVAAGSPWTSVDVEGVVLGRPRDSPERTSPVQDLLLSLSLNS